MKHKKTRWEVSRSGLDEDLTDEENEQLDQLFKSLVGVMRLGPGRPEFLMCAIGPRTRVTVISGGETLRSEDGDFFLMVTVDPKLPLSVEVSEIGSHRHHHPQPPMAFVYHDGTASLVTGENKVVVIAPDPEV
jgi:hypothetical protein